jgi:ABC-type multidrug transport system ATPase subunit
LIELSKEGITVVITTHYIEEARSANIVAFMRQGILLKEGNPEVLIEKLNLQNLEEVFLRLCNNKESDTCLFDSSKNSNHKSENKILNEVEVINNSLQKSNSLSQSKLLMKRNKIADHFARSSALFHKNVIRIYRNLPALIFTAIIPALQCMANSYCYSYLL